MEATSENEAKLEGPTHMVHTRVFTLHPGRQKHKDRRFSYLPGWVFLFCPILKGSADGEADGDADWSASQATCFNIHDITSAPGRQALHG